MILNNQIIIYLSEFLPIYGIYCMSLLNSNIYHTLSSKRKIIIYNYILSNIAFKKHNNKIIQFTNTSDVITLNKLKKYRCMIPTCGILTAIKPYCIQHYIQIIINKN